MRRLLAVLLAMTVGTTTAWPYPLDGGGETGIARLEGYRLAQEGKVRGRRLPAGALLKTEQVDIQLAGHAADDLPEVDAAFTDEVLRLLGPEADRYGLAVLDLSDPDNPRYAQHRGTVDHNPGSVGKLLVALGVFQALADLFPDLDERLRLLRTVEIVADDFILSDHHVVPFWNPQSTRLRHRPLQIGDRANLWTYLDWMLSASSNAAASMVIKEVMTMRHFGDRYPVGDDEKEVFWAGATRKELATLLAAALREPLTRNGFDLEQLRQGKFFTRTGQARVGGPSSRANSRELMRFLLRLEQGRIIDPFSSREIKRLLYMTQRRIRYASAPALAESAVCFKSGSLYACRPEAGFRCGKYMGNVINMMNSVAIVEAPTGKRRLHYLVVVMSNVLRKNSAVAHQTLATRLHRLIEANARVGPDDSESDRPDRPEPR